MWSTTMSMLGPLLFLWHISHMPKCSNTSEFLLFADDTNLFLNNLNILNLEINLNVELEKVSQWQYASKLSFNIGVSNNSDCTYCGQPDLISHIFIECHHSKQFFHKVLQHFNEESVTSFTKSVEELTFGKPLNFGKLQRHSLQKN